MHILVIEDEEQLCRSIAEGLRLNGYETDTCFDGDEGLELCLTENYDLILLDLNLPGIDGLEILRQFREINSFTPVLILSARGQIQDKVEGLDLGANDYLTKPFSVEELLARLRVTQRRLLLLKSSNDAGKPVFQNGELKIDYAANCVYLKGEEMHLTPIEYKLLCLLSHNVGKVLTHTYITMQIWGSSRENDIASLRVFMATLRKKLEPEKTSPQYIQTHIGIGYRMLRVD